MKSCRKDGKYRCRECVFSIEESMYCANPVISSDNYSGDDSYFKSKSEELTEDEKKSIKKAFD